MGEKIEHTAEVLGYLVLSVIAALAALLIMVIVRYTGKTYNRWKYESLKRQNAELEWEQIRHAWRMEDRQDEDRNTFDDISDSIAFEEMLDYVEQDRHDTLELYDIPEQLYNYQEELRYEGR